MSVEKKVPEIRFKGFSGEWEEKLLGELVTCFSGGTPLVGVEEYYKGNIPFIRSAEINKVTTELTISESGLKNSSAKIVELGTVLYALYGATSGEVGRARIYGAINQAILAIVPKAKICPEFLAHWLRKNKENIVSTYLQGGQGNLSGEIVKNLILKLPDFEEQTQIGNYFQKLDSLINQHQQKHDKLSNIKKSMLEKMFPKQGETIPEIRFKGFSGEWEENTLSNKVEFFSGLTYSPSDIRKSGALVLRSSNVKNGQLIEADDVYVNPGVVNCSNVIEGDVVVVVRNGSRSLIGKHAQVTSRMDNTVIGAFMTGIRSKQPAFINALLDTNTFTTEVERNLGATINQITNGSFKSMIFMFPTEDEQQEIGNYFQKLNTLINQHQQQITKLNNIKQACLSKMFV